MAKKTFNLSIKCDEETYRAIQREAVDKGRDMSPQGLHLIKLGFLLLKQLDGHDSLDRTQKILSECTNIFARKYRGDADP